MCWTGCWEDTPSPCPGHAPLLGDAAAQRHWHLLPLRYGVHRLTEASPVRSGHPDQELARRPGKEGLPEEPTPGAEPKRQQREGLEAGRTHLGDGNGPTQLERRMDVGRAATVARGPGGEPEHLPASASQFPRAWGRGGGKCALKNRTSVQCHCLDAPHKEQSHVSRVCQSCCWGGQ